MAINETAYCVEVLQRDGLRAAQFGRVPLLEVLRSTPDCPQIVRGLLPADVAEIGPGYRVRVTLGDRPLVDAPVAGTEPQWSDTRKRLVDRYVSMHEVVAFEASIPAPALNDEAAGTFVHRKATVILRELVQAAPNRLHYHIDHHGYPEGARREWSRFQVRSAAEAQLPVGGIDRGSWVGPDRIDATLAYARDGRTIAGLRVDGAAWPDVRLLLLDCEEMALDTAAVARHPDVAGWTAERYAASGYAVRAEGSRSALQALLEAKGVSWIELHTYRAVTGEFAARVDERGRYVGLVYGGGECINAAMVELGRADVALPGEGRMLVPAMRLKDYYSYVGPHSAGIADRPESLARFELEGGALEHATALAYAAGGSVWSLGDDGAISLRRPERPDHVVLCDPLRCDAAYGEDLVATANVVRLLGDADFSWTFSRETSVGRIGAWERTLNYPAVSRGDDAGLLIDALIDDVGYPRVDGALTFPEARTDIRVGDLVELRGEGIRRVAPAIPGQWGGRYAGRIVGRVDTVQHVIAGRKVTTTIRLTSPLRSVADPIAFMARSQRPSQASLQFRLDTAGIGLDGAPHLD